MSHYVLIALFVIIVVGFAAVAAYTIYCNLRMMNVTIDNNNKILHFYDLSTSPFYEGEVSHQAFEDLLEFLYKKNSGEKAVISKAARDRFVPVTKRSTIVLSLLSLWEIVQTVGTIILFFAVLFGALAFVGTPL